jgi:putative integral membrane protein (TIGR02587 family)
MSMTTRAEDPLGWKQERQDLLRAVAAGAIVGMPLLYTMEMWEHGQTLSPWHQLGVLAATLIINLFFCWIVGIREPDSLAQAALDAVTSVGIALLFSTIVLLLIGMIPRASSLEDAAGKVVLCSCAVSLGVSFANSRRGQSRTGDDDKGDEPKEEPAIEERRRRQLNEDLRDIAAAVLGSTLFALNIAPTEEVAVVAMSVGPWGLLLLLAVSLGLCYAILQAYENQPVHVAGPLQTPAAETIITVAISLLTGLMLLWLTGERGIFASPPLLVSHVVALGLPAVVGGAAGRLAV